MYKVMIIDDEKAARNLIKRLINWDELDLAVVGEAESGVEAINVIDEIQPDIALVDIRMPFMDGLTFARFMREMYSEMVIIIVSAFQDFEYARQCIEIGISQYLLKPVSRVELTKALRTAVEKVRQRQPVESPEPVEKLQVDQYIYFIKENYSDAQLNLTYVSKKFYFNPAYFSRKFKEKTGTNFIDYLTEYRIEKACELAKAGKKMYQAAEEVGIPDPNYFSRCFKKHKGKTYSEYVKHIEDNIDETKQE